MNTQFSQILSKARWHWYCWKYDNIFFDEIIVDDMGESKAYEIFDEPMKCPSNAIEWNI